MISEQTLDYLAESNLSLEEFVYLCNPRVVTEYNFEHAKRSLEAKGLMRDGIITSQAAQMVTALTPLEEGWDHYFEMWWSAYPLTDGWGPWAGTSTKRTAKIKTKQAFKIALKESRLTGEQMIKQLEGYVQQLKDMSVHNNQLTYLPSSYNYLSQRYYLNRQKSAQTITRTDYGKDLE